MCSSDLEQKNHQSNIFFEKRWNMPFFFCNLCYRDPPISETVAYLVFIYVVCGTVCELILFYSTFNNHFKLHCLCSSWILCAIIWLLTSSLFLRRMEVVEIPTTALLEIMKKLCLPSPKYRHTKLQKQNWLLRPCCTWRLAVLVNLWQHLTVQLSYGHLGGCK